MAKTAGRSLVVDAYEQLREEILTGTFVPGQRLLLNELAASRGVSLGVIREAVTRLASEELLESSPQHGFHVRRLSLEDLEDLTWLRVRLETLALREAIAHGTLAWEAELVAAHHALARTPMWRDGETANPEWMSAHRAFHAALAAGAGRRRLQDVRQQLFDASELYRYWAGAVGGVSPAELLASHAAILEATLARDADRAAALLEEHLSRTAEHLAERAGRDALLAASDPD